MILQNLSRGSNHGYRIAQDIKEQSKVVHFNAVGLRLARPGAEQLPPGMLVADALRVSADRGVYGPGDPEGQVSAFMATDRSRAGRLRRRTFNGRSFDVLQAPLPDGGYVGSRRRDHRVWSPRAPSSKPPSPGSTPRCHAGRTGLATFGPDRGLLFANGRFAELARQLPPIGRLSASRSPRCWTFWRRVRNLPASTAPRSIAAQREADRSQPSATRRVRTGGQVIDIVSDPLADGGWTMAVTDISALARAEDDARRRATLLSSILDAVPHGVCVDGPDRRVADVQPCLYGRHDRRPPGSGRPCLRRPSAVVPPRANTAPVIRSRSTANRERSTSTARSSASGGGRTACPWTSARRRCPTAAISASSPTSPSSNAAEEEVSRRAQELDVMLSCIRHGVMLWGADKRLRTSNAIVTDLLAYPPGLLVPGQSEAVVLDEMLARGHFGSGEQARAQVAMLAKLDRSKPYRRQLLTPANRVLDTRSDPTPGGGWVTTFTDVTEAEAVQNELRRAKEVAEAANQAKSRFLATMSHELRHLSIWSSASLTLCCTS